MSTLPMFTYALMVKRENEDRHESDLNLAKIKIEHACYHKDSEECKRAITDYIAKRETYNNLASKR